MKQNIVYVLIALAAAGCDFPDPVHVSEYTSNDEDLCRKYGSSAYGDEVAAVVGIELGHSQQALVYTPPKASQSGPVADNPRLLLDIRSISCGDWVHHDLQARLLFRNLKTSDALTEPTPEFPMMEPPRITEWTPASAPLTEQQFATAFGWHETLKSVDAASLTLSEPEPFTVNDWQDIKLRFAARPGLPDHEIYLSFSLFIWEDEVTHLVFHKAH